MFQRTYVGAALKLPAPVKMTNLTLCPWGSKSRNSASLARMELSFPEMSVNEAQAVFQVCQCRHQWTQPFSHSLTAEPGIAFAFPTSVGVGSDSLMDRPGQSPAGEKVNQRGCRCDMWVLLVKIT